MTLQVVFLCLIAAHLLGDFAFQTSWEVEGKKAAAPRAYVSHGAIHLLLTAALLVTFIPTARTLWSTYALALGVALIHLFVDRLKEAWALRRPRPSWLVFLVDQGLHLLTLFVAATLVTDSTIGGRLQATDAWLATNAGLLLGLATCYLAVVFGGGYLIREILSAVDLPESGEEDPGYPGQERLGMYIGWLERTVIVTALLAGSPALVGFVVTAKAVIRFRETEPHFAEYFLLGTFLSLILAGAGGMLLRGWLLGEPTFND